MGSTSRRSKCSKRSDEASISSLESDEYSENEIGSDKDSEMEMELTLDQSEQDEKDDSGMDSEAEDDEENNVEEGEDNERSAVQRDAEMEVLEIEYQALRSKEQDLLKNLRRHKDEDVIKGEAVKNQKALWDKTLEFRFLLQKSFSASNKLPQEPVKSYFCNSDTTADESFLELISSSKQTLNSLLELQEALLENNHSITQGNGKGSCKDDGLSSDVTEEKDEEWSSIYKSHDRIKDFRNNSIDKWHRKMQVTTGAAAFRGRLNAFNKNVSDQIDGYMRDPNQMIKRMQLRSSSVGVFGNVPAVNEKTTEEDGNVDGDPELIDDSEFYQQLLKEFFESCDPASSESAFYALKKLQPKKRKIVDRRASKSRKIRYNVHEKIANFMAPVPMNLPPMAPKLFENLFGMGSNSKSAVA
ncbi:putative uncharacterized protein DDB_G0270496 isoform X2 [Phalaenopsis equestris]|uniref:putative uncharacterized protein DDB_G0270496 isoform X2 n=1 Tax=Phalaenopsis equestris TaxID=78828 RepID=UPI0009E2C378|nr:putative uncharacterized protein DDB_G0270496 isoform X2 [Phalaenopsis equestris]